MVYKYTTSEKKDRRTLEMNYNEEKHYIMK